MFASGVGGGVVFPAIGSDLSMWLDLLKICSSAILSQMTEADGPRLSRHASGNLNIN